MVDVAGPMAHSPGVAPCRCLLSFFPVRHAMARHAAFTSPSAVIPHCAIACMSTVQGRVCTGTGTL